MNPPLSRSERPAFRGAARHQSGVALIETLVALLIFSVGLLGLFGLAARAINFSVNAEDRNRAALFASDVASTMWTLGTVDVPAATLTAWQAAVTDTTHAGVPQGTISVTKLGTTNRADIKITWKETNAQPTDPPNQLTTRVILP
jgi:type IV pilus assembly protein PilV